MAACVCRLVAAALRASAMAQATEAGFQAFKGDLLNASGLWRRRDSRERDRAWISPGRADALDDGIEPPKCGATGQ